MKEPISSLSLEKERALVEKAKEDPEAFGTLYNIYLPKIYALVGYKVVTDRATIEDITSEIFMKAFGKLHTFEWQKVPFRAWLYQIARNHIIDWYRSQKNGKLSSIESLEESGWEISSSQDLADETQVKFQHEEVVKKMKTLSEKEQECLHLKFAMNFNNREIAGLTPYSESDVGTTIYRALKKLKKFL